MHIHIRGMFLLSKNFIKINSLIEKGNPLSDHGPMWSSLGVITAGSEQCHGGCRNSGIKYLPTLMLFSHFHN